MKTTKLLLTALCVGSVLSCTKDSDLSNANEQVEVILEAFSGEDDVETKTVRQSDGATWWADGDQISLFFGNGNNGGSCFTTATGGETASFSGTLNAFTAGGEGYAGETTYFWGVYPYSTSNTCDNSSVTLNIPSVQPGVAGTFAPGVNISVGRSENLKMGFYNVCSGFSFSVSTEGITELMFKANNDTPIVGDATVEFVTGKPVVTSLTNTSSEIHIFPEGGTFEVGQKYYLEFIPTTLDGFKVTIYNNRAQEASYEYTSSRTFQRGMFTSISNINTRVGAWTARKGNITFADPNFKAYCVEKFDTDNDGEISYEEALKVTSISYLNQSATSLDEIRYFTSIETFACINNRLTSLDVSNNTALKYLYCNNNQLTSLDVSQNTALTVLWCNDNQLTSLDVSYNIALDDLMCGVNQLTDLNVSNNSALTSLSCDLNRLTNLDISNNTALTILSCGGNQLTDLNVSNNSALTSLFCDLNRLTNLDINNNTVLKFLTCEGNQLTSLDVSNNTSLNSLDCSPMNDENGQNLLKTLYIFNGQNISGVTSNRNSAYIPDETVITDSNPGSGEGTGEDELEDDGNEEQHVHNDHEYVDLGITVNGQKLLWATTNVGAEAATDYGDYFAWGETRPYYHRYSDGTLTWGSSNGYALSSYKYAKQNSNYSNVGGYEMTKYSLNNNFGKYDGKSVLEPEDDAASQNWGGSWRMPTTEELVLLRSQCVKEYVESYNGVSVRGYILYKAKSDEDKGAYTTWNTISSEYTVSDPHIFLPVGGYYTGKEIRYSTYGYYWSSTLSIDNSKLACELDFLNLYFAYSSATDRHNGCAIRPVCVLSE